MKTGRCELAVKDFPFLSPVKDPEVDLFFNTVKFCQIFYFFQSQSAMHNSLFTFQTSMWRSRKCPLFTWFAAAPCTVFQCPCSEHNTNTRIKQTNKGKLWNNICCINQHQMQSQSDLSLTSLIIAIHTCAKFHQYSIQVNYSCTVKQLKYRILSTRRYQGHTFSMTNQQILIFFWMKASFCRCLNTRCFPLAWTERSIQV